MTVDTVGIISKGLLHKYSTCKKNGNLMRDLVDVDDL